MNDHTGLKKCERCGKAFECKPEHITECQCYGIPFTENQKKETGKRYSDCLCRSCLLELSKQG